MRSLKYLGVSAISVGVTYFLTQLQDSKTSEESLGSSTKKIAKREPKPKLISIEEKPKPSSSIPVQEVKSLPKVKKIVVKPVVEKKQEPMQIDRSMFPMEFGGKKKKQDYRSNSRPKRNSSRWEIGDQVQQDSSWYHSQDKTNYNTALAGKSTTELRDFHRKKFLELVVQLPAEYQEKYAVNDWDIPKELKKKVALEKKLVDASTFGESLTFLERSLTKLAKAHQQLAGLDEPIAPPSWEEIKSNIVNKKTPTEVFNSVLEKTHNASNMLEQIRMDILDACAINIEDEPDIKTMAIEKSSSVQLNSYARAEVTSTVDVGGGDKALSLEEIVKLDNDVTDHYLAYLDYAYQIVLDWHHRRKKMRPKPGTNVKIRLKEMTMEEQKEWLKILPPDPSIPAKFWYQRLRLFSKYEEGIQLDTEGWFSTTPELIAKMIARRMGKGVVLDAMCGAGGNTIQMALNGASVLALDHNYDRLEMCRHNARIYGVEDKITFLCGDVFEKLAQMIKEKVKVDAIFLAPPWGGQFYEQTKFDIRMMPVDGMKLFKKAEELCGNIAMYLPRNVDTNQVRNLSESGCEIAKNRLYGKVKSVTCYYGDLNLFKAKVEKDNQR